jgi:hypothetical protein
MQIIREFDIKGNNILLSQEYKLGIGNNIQGDIRIIRI